MRRSIFVIDDYSEALELVSEALETEGFTARPFRDPVSALLALRQTTPALILLDWHLPQLTGAEFLRQLRRPVHLRELPVVIVTGDSRVGSVAGTQGVLLKPIDLPTLIATVSRWIFRATLGTSPVSASP